ncbi:MAG: GGDEF domain-containing protein [Burkholderiaceae bacterium]
MLAERQAQGRDDPDTDRSAELLRMALPMISRHGRGFAPISYAVWYEYVRGENLALRSEVDEVLKSSDRLSQDLTFDVYQRHVIGRYEEAVLKGRASLLDVLEQVDKSVEDASTSAGMFDDRLMNFSAAIDSPGAADNIQNQIVELREDLDIVSKSMRGLNTQLAHSRSEVQRLAEELARTREEAQMDPLTGLLNRRIFASNSGSQIEQSQAATRKDPHHLTLVMVDIDNFKAINDEHGHIFGDKVIQGVARILNDGVMRKDHVARYGGEEFALILPETDIQGGAAVAERIRESVARSRIRRANSGPGADQHHGLAGVAQYKPGETDEQLIDRADQALYAAKQAGRNRVAKAP